MAAFDPEAIDWELVNARLPVTKEEKPERLKLWKAIDNNGSGYVSLAELDKGISVCMGLGDNIRHAKPALMRAFQYAKNTSKSKTKLGEDFIEWREFRTFLVAFRQRLEYFVAFKRIDSGNDGRINLKEFVAAKEMIEKWVGPIEDAEATFKEIDANGGGQVLFDEFCSWSLNKGLDLDDDAELL